MATVTDSLLLTAANDIVTNFLDKKASLNEGVIKKAGELGLNTDQTSRLIERTNTEAFLRIYPNDTEFEVASPEAVMGVKTSSIVPDIKREEAPEEGLFKAASIKNSIPEAASYTGRFSDEDIFGMDNEFFKTASSSQYEYAIDKESQWLCEGICAATKTASEIKQEELIKEERIDKALTDIVDMVKQSSLSGVQGVGEAESELLNYYPKYAGLVSATFDVVTEKMASAMVEQSKLTRSEGIVNYKYASATPLTNKFQMLLNALGE